MEENAKRLSSFPRFLSQADRVVQILGLYVGIACLEALLDSLLPNLYHDTDAAMERHRKGLGPAHATQSSGEEYSPFEFAREVLLGNFPQRFKRTFDHVLGSDVFPWSCRV